MCFAVVVHPRHPRAPRLNGSSRATNLRKKTPAPSFKREPERATELYDLGARCEPLGNLRPYERLQCHEMPRVTETIANLTKKITDHLEQKAAKNGALASELFAPTVAIHTPDGVLNGLDGASALLQAYATAFPDFRLIIDDLVADADKVAFRWTFNGTHRGPLANIPASGKQVSVSNNVGIFRIADGKVNESRLCWDKYALLQQVGALPPSS